MASASVAFKYFLAFFGLFLIVSAWVTMAEVVGKIPNPYFVGYFVHSFYSVGYIIWIVWKVFPGNFRCNKAQDGKLTWKRALILSGVFNVVSLAGGITWYLSLERTSVAANTAIYMSLPAFIFVLSVPVLRERPTVLKVLAVFVQVGGVCIVAVSKDPCAQGHPNSTDSSNSSHILGVSTKTHCGQPGTPLGYVLLLISVLTYALFEILYKKFASFKDDPASIPNSFRMIGLIGIHCLVYSWPLVIIAHFSGLQPFQWPTLLEFKYILMTSVLDFILNVSLILVVSLTSPLFAGVGQVMVLPVGVVTDYLIHHYTLVWYGFIGVAMIVLGFLSFNISHFWEKKVGDKLSIQMEQVDSLNASSTGEISNKDTATQRVEEDIPLLQKKTSSRLIWKRRLLKYLI